MPMYKVPDVFLLLLLSLVFVTQISMSASVQTASRTLSAQGTITSGNSGAKLRFSMNFDSFATGTIRSSSGHLPALDFTWIQIDNLHGGSGRVFGDDGSSGIPLRRGPGTKVLGLEYLDGQSGDRTELNIYLQSAPIGLAQKAYVTTWLYLPSDWAMYQPGIDWNWFQIVNQAITYDGSLCYPKAAINLGQPDITKQIFTVESSYQTVYEGTIYGSTLNPYDLPRGRWFQLSWFVDRENGILTSWSYDPITEIKTLISDVHGPSMIKGTYPWYIIPAKVYGSLYGHDYTIWTDGFEIWDGIP